VLPARGLPGRGYGIDVIGAALLGAARGQGHRSLAARVQVPAATVRSWLRRASSNSEALRRLGVQTVVDLDPELLPTRARPGWARPSPRSPRPRWLWCAASAATSATCGR
jgi:hypothetical protein